VIDLHSHILPGLDDGVETVEDAVALARAAAEDGIRAIAATPHVRHDYPTTPDEMEERLRVVRGAVAEAGIPIRVLPGGEIALDRVLNLEESELNRFGLGGNPRVLLVEFPYAGWPLSLESRLFDLAARGFTTVLAHPERNRDVQRHPERLETVARNGTLLQVTAASLEGRLGRGAQAAARGLVEDGLAHLLASDAHAPSVRAVGLRAAAEMVGDPALAQWLTQDVPAALVAGTAIPLRPDVRPRRRHAIRRLRDRRR
jgi:protein-tyrosine phosphatase